VDVAGIFHKLHHHHKKISSSTKIFQCSLHPNPKMPLSPPVATPV